MRLRKRSLTASHFFELVGVAVDGHARVYERYALGFPCHCHTQQVQVIGQKMIITQGKDQGPWRKIVSHPFFTGVHCG